MCTVREVVDMNRKCRQLAILRKALRYSYLNRGIPRHAKPQPYEVRKHQPRLDQVLSSP